MAVAVPVAVASAEVVPVAADEEAVEQAKTGHKRQIGTRVKSSSHQTYTKCTKEPREDHPFRLFGLFTLLYSVTVSYDYMFEQEKRVVSLSFGSFVLSLCPCSNYYFPSGGRSGGATSVGVVY